MLTEKQKRDNETAWKHSGRKLRCTKCGITMKDTEPMTERGDFYHHDTGQAKGCKNANKNFDWEVKVVHPGSRPFYPIRDHGIQQILPKKYRRAQKRGAKQASKHRPR